MKDRQKILEQIPVRHFLAATLGGHECPFVFIEQNLGGGKVCHNVCWVELFEPNQSRHPQDVEAWTDRMLNKAVFQMRLNKNQTLANFSLLEKDRAGNFRANMVGLANVLEDLILPESGGSVFFVRTFIGSGEYRGIFADSAAAAKDFLAPFIKESEALVGVIMATK